MTDVANALGALGITEWVLRGEPTNETEFNNMFRKVTGTDSNGSAIESSDPKDFGTTWSAVSAKKTELINAEPMKLLRQERDLKLAATDWWGSSDLTMSSDRKTYRQALRDLPANQSPTVDSEGRLKDVTWPTKPS
tara:strand:- start:454 stop:861 length:408 start_codon:yes stop_codon:yes gene_type:complete